VLGSVVLLAAAPAAVTGAGSSSAACAATVVHYQPAKHPTLGELPWVLARPEKAAVLAFLLSYQGTLRDGRVNDSDGLVLWRTGEKIVWTVPVGSPTLVAKRLDGPGSFRVPLTAGPDDFVSAPRFPAAGCWRLRLGPASVVARVVPRPAQLACDATPAADQGLTVARPRSSGIAGVFSWRTDDGRLLLYTHGLGPDDVSAKVLWWSRKEGGLFRLTGTRLDGDGVFRQQLQEAGVSSHPAGYRIPFPSIVDVPASGCWLLRLRTRTQAGVLVVIARDR